ncbi:MAG: MBL fold metallo-hydrolase [Oscillospiraceae bacterium]|nr:MBL fold metallo-hydrolase [Oscillospiraceae bacterium]
MELQRTANAGVLLTMDGVSILLDGLADRVEHYLPTPAEMVEKLMENPPDVLAFTHYHKDHCSDALLLTYRKQNLRPILGPELLHKGAVRMGDVTITPIASRHLGRVEPDLQHVSYIIKGSQCVWFMGDAAPMQWKDRSDLPRPDLLIGPYAYANTKSAWEVTKRLTDKVMLLHLPPREADPYGLWDSVEQTVANREIPLWIPQIGEKISI